MTAAATEKRHRVLITVRAEIQEILPTGENQGTAKHAAKEYIQFDGETLEDAKRKLAEYLSFSKTYF